MIAKIKASKKPVAFLELVGGLGNQLFIYAYALYLRDVLGYAVILDTKHFKPNNESKYNWGENVRNLELLNFDLDLEDIYIKKLSKRDIWEILPLKEKARFIGLKIKKRFSKRARRRVYDIDFSKFDDFFVKSMLKIPPYRFVFGYFTSYLYFHKHFNFRLKNDVVDAPNRAWLDKIKLYKHSCGIHLRRGDYLNIDSFINLARSYYEAAIAHFLELLGMDLNKDYIKLKMTNGGGSSLEAKLEAKRKNEAEKNQICFFVFSNDLDFARGIFSDLMQGMGLTFFIVDCNDEAHAACELNLMKTCAHQIIANSTFSFWAAYLNENPNKIILHPDSYITSRADKNADFFPSNWHKIGALWGEIYD